MITFCGFEEADLDTIIVIRYSGGSGFLLPVDSLATHGELVGSCFQAQVFGFSIDSDYLVRTPGTGDEFRLSGFEVTRIGCNRCFPFEPESDFYDELASYLVNDQRQAGSDLTIYR